MNLLGLNGLGLWYGRIDRYFTSGCFPYKWNWRASHAQWVMDYYTERHGDEPYCLVGFSDGGTLAHEIAQVDERCQALIVHSGMWRAPKTVRKIPTLLLITKGDRTPTDRETWRAAVAYSLVRGWDGLVLRECEKTTWHGHEFANGLEAMREWCRDELDWELPVQQ